MPYTVWTPDGVIWLTTDDESEAHDYAEWLNNGGFERTAEFLKSYGNVPAEYEKPAQVTWED